MSDVFWPETLAPRQVLFSPEGQSTSGGVTETGFEQVVVGSSGRWRAKLVFDVRPIRAALWQQRVLAARAIIAHLNGRANRVLIGPYDYQNTPAAIEGQPTAPFSIPHDDDAFFSDGAGYNQFATPCHVTSAGDMGRSSLLVTMEAGHAPQAGQYFGLKSGELYLIRSAIGLGDGGWRLNFIPTLRNDTAPGEAVDFDQPVCRMRSAVDRPLDLDFGRMFTARAEIDLVEAN